MSKEKHLPFALTNDEKVSEKVKQIEEMASMLCGQIKSCTECTIHKPCLMMNCATILYHAGYRKQSEGEWQIAVDPVEATFICSKCGYFYIEADPQAKTEYKYCPHCGARMKGGEE